MFIQPEARSTSRAPATTLGRQISKARGAARKPKRDPLVKLLGTYKDLTADCRKAAAAMIAAEKTLLKDNAKIPVIHTRDVLDDDIEDVRIMIGYSSFSWAPKIKLAIAQQRRRLTAEIRATRADARSAGPTQTESKLQLVRFMAHLARIPTIENKLLAALASEEKRVNRLQRVVRWRDKQLAYGQAYRDLWTTFEKINNAEIKSRDGALALIEVTAVMLQAGVMVATQLPLILERAHRFLSKEKH